jgi:hypothetical protein
MKVRKEKKATKATKALESKPEVTVAPEPETSVVVNGPALVEPAKPEPVRYVAGKPAPAKQCPVCGSEIPRRYRICDPCLAKRQEARKASKKVAAATPATAVTAPAQAQA